MTKYDLDSQEYSRLLTTISAIIHSKGLKATTMDSVAAAIGISKRTLYEIFGSKNEMVINVMNYFGDRMKATSREIYRNASNVLEAMSDIFEAHTKIMKDMSPDFFRDMDRLYCDIRKDYDNIEAERNHELDAAFARGIKEGLLRTDINYDIITRLFKIQLESLKRMEESFPPGISIAEAFDYIASGFLRSIVTSKGLRVLDKIKASRKNPDDLASSLSFDYNNSQDNQPDL